MFVHRRSAHSIRMTMLLATLCVSGCSTRGVPAPQNVFEFEFENVSPASVRLALRSGEREILARRIGPFETRTIRMPTGVLPAGSPSVRLVVVPIGTPSVFPERYGERAIVSEPYPVGDVLGLRWVFSGSRIMAGQPIR